VKILITGATGNIGSRVTRRLIELGHRPCVLVRDAAKARELFGARVDIRVRDLSKQRPSLKRALVDVDRVFLLNSGPRLAARDRRLALAAREAGVKHLVKLSTLDVLTGVGTGPWHARGEAAVVESGVPHTFIRPAAFMSNAFGWADTIAREGVVWSSTGRGKIAFIHPDDLAEVVTQALLQGPSLGESLVITGPEALSYGEMTETIGEVIGRRVRRRQLTDEEALEGALAFGGRQYAAALVDIWRAIRAGRLSTVTDGVERHLGRKPLGFRHWVEEHSEAFR
jgi:uncharacterized protein YbjT (DUF2867 family)